jgi:GT2 family glycosyltransferase
VDAILILTPVKDARPHLATYLRSLERLTYPAGRLSLGFLESDSADDTYAALESRLPELRRRFRRVGLWKKDFGYRVPSGLPRWAPQVQLMRRTVLARSRNHLLMRALDDEDWVLWLDADVVESPPDVLERLLATGKSIVHPHCVLDYGGPTFDRNAWREHGRVHLDALRKEGDLVRLDAVGGTMLLVRADIHRDGLVFPSFPYGRTNPAARPDHPELDTEGLGLMARDMGHQCWGMPNLEIRHARA